MKQIAIIMITVLFIGCVENSKEKNTDSIKQDQQLVSELIKLNDGQDYFNLRSQFNKRKNELSNIHASFFDAIIKNAFNNPKGSNQAIETILKNDSNTLEDSLMKTLYLKKLNNHVRLFEYKEAAATNKHLRKNISVQNDLTLFEDLENTFNLYNALTEVPKLEVIRNSDVKIPLTRDIANLLNIDVSFGDSTQAMVFDTGANMSVIRKSYVEKFGLKLIESDFLVNAATGTKVKSELAVAEEMRIGDIIIKNEVFLVFDDSALSWPGYDIYGIIGFPVIEALDEIHILKENQLFIPKETTTYNNKNLAIKQLIPIISVVHKEDTLTFQLDTGAQATTLFPKYYKKYRDEIEQKYTKEVFGAGSAGGSVAFDGYLIDDVNLKIGNSSAQLNELQLLIEKIKETESNFHGNLGQDYIKQFNKMIISFKHASIVFE